MGHRVTGWRLTPAYGTDTCTGTDTSADTMADAAFDAQADVVSDASGASSHHGGRQGGPDGSRAPWSALIVLLAFVTWRRRVGRTRSQTAGMSSSQSAW